MVNCTKLQRTTDASVSRDGVYRVLVRDKPFPVYYDCLLMATPESILMEQREKWC
jgi:hypothetical protein